MTRGPLTFHIVGDAYVDIMCFLEGDMPESGGDSRLEQPITRYAGGSSTNTATHLHALNKNFIEDEKIKKETTVVLSTVLNETDQFGAFLLEHVKKHQFGLVNCNQGNESISTGHCVAIVSRGERSFMTHQGCVGVFKADHLDIKRIVNTNHDAHIHIAGYFNVEGFHNGSLKSALEQIRNGRKKQGTTTVSLVTQHDASKQWDGGLKEVAPLLDFLIMNELEANSILKMHSEPTIDMKTMTADDSKKAWSNFFNKWNPTTCVIVTLGAQGAVAFRNNEIKASITPAVKVTNVVDPTGAGDSFTAGFLYGIWKWKRANVTNGMDEFATEKNVEWPGQAIQEGLCWGCAVGTSAVTIRGASNPAPPQIIRDFYVKQASC